MPETPPTAGRRTRRAATVLALVTVLIGGVIAGSLAAPIAATAATAGPGYDQPGRPLFHLGGYLAPDGRVAYCIDAGLPSAIGKPTTDAGVVPQVNGLDPATMQRLDLILSRYGQTSDPTVSAAVAMAVWSIAGNPAYQAEGGDGFVLQRAPAATRAAIQALADRFRSEAAAWTPPAGSATLTLSTDAADSANGTLTVATTPASVTGRIVLTDAVFVDSGSAERAVTAGGTFAIRATPPSPEPYRVSAKGTFTAPGGPAAEVHLYTTPAAQTLVSAGSSTTLSFTATVADNAARVVPAPVPPTPAAVPRVVVPPLIVPPVAVRAVHLPVVSG